MKNKILTVSAFAAGIMAVSCAENGIWLPSLAGIGWITLLFAAMKRPRAATRGKRSCKSHAYLNMSAATLQPSGGDSDA